MSVIKALASSGFLRQLEYESDVVAPEVGSRDAKSPPQGREDAEFSQTFF